MFTYFRMVVKTAHLVSAERSAGDGLRHYTTPKRAALGLTPRPRHAMRLMPIQLSTKPANLYEKQVGIQSVSIDQIPLRQV